MGMGVPKALMMLGGRPLLDWSLDLLATHPQVADVVVVGPPDGLEEMGQVVAGRAALVPGGATRAHSVQRGLAALRPDATHVLVHDAARPLLTAALVSDVIAALNAHDAAIAASPVTDTLKAVGADATVIETIDRSRLWAAQTPQGARRSTLLAAYARLDASGYLAATDCASILEAAGVPVRIVASHEANPKVTHPADVALAEHLLRERAHAGEQARNR